MSESPSEAVSKRAKRKQKWDRKYYRYVKKPRGEWLPRSGRPREASVKWTCAVDEVNAQWLVEHVPRYRLSGFVNAAIAIGIVKLDPGTMSPLTGRTRALAWKLSLVLQEWLERKVKDRARFVNGCIGYTILSLGVRPEVGEIERLARLGRRPVVSREAGSEAPGVPELRMDEEILEVADLETVPEPGGQKQRIIKI